MGVVAAVEELGIAYYIAVGAVAALASPATEGELGMEDRLGARLARAQNSEISRNCRFIIVSFSRTWGCVTSLLMRRSHARVSS